MEEHLQTIGLLKEARPGEHQQVLMKEKWAANLPVNEQQDDFVEGGGYLEQARLCSTCSKAVVVRRARSAATAPDPKTGCYHQSMTDHRSITQLLNQWGGGDKAAEALLTPMVYDELQRLAQRLFRGERRGHTLQPTALVHEAFVKLVDVEITWQDRAHFFSLAARMMRRLLVNHANARTAAKRGGEALRVTFDEALGFGGDADADLLDLEEALQSLAQLDARKAELIELQYFGGLSFREMEAVTGLSSSTLDRDLRFTRAWLKDWLAKK